jgi:hypothetical protein
VRGGSEQQTHAGLFALRFGAAVRGAMRDARGARCAALHKQGNPVPSVGRDPPPHPPRPPRELASSSSELRTQEGPACCLNGIRS